jgi:quercetin dioxygenase-like cupin family protein
MDDDLQPVDLNGLSDTLLAKAREAHAGRAAENLILGQAHALSQTVIALTAGHELAEHESPGEATLLVLGGRVTFHAGDRSRALTAGDLLPIPPERHSVSADEDSVLVLTVVKSSR